MSLFNGTFTGGPCESRDEYSGGSLCGGRIFTYLGDYGAKCCTCGATYDLSELDALTDAAEENRERGAA